MSKILEPFACGGSAAILASCVIHPIDLAKVRMQIYGQLNPGKPVPSFPGIIKGMVQREGVGSIYKGLDAAIGRQMVYGTARIGLHRTFSDYLVKDWNDGKPLNFGIKTVSGMASGAIAVCIGTPFDIALVRLQADGMAIEGERRNYRNVFDALTRTAKEEVRHGLEKRGGKRGGRHVCSYYGNTPYSLHPYDIRPFNKAIGRNDITPVYQTAANKLSANELS